MPALPSYMYADPMIVLMNKQINEARRSCAGCVHGKAIKTPFGGTVTVCVKGKPYGKKCGRYEVQNEDKS